MDMLPQRTFGELVLLCLAAASEAGQQGDKHLRVEASPARHRVPSGADPEVVAGLALAGLDAGVAAARAVATATPLAVVPELPVHPATGTTLSSSLAASRRARYERVSGAGGLLSRIWSPSGPDPLRLQPGHPDRQPRRGGLAQMILRLGQLAVTVGTCSGTSNHGPTDGFLAQNGLSLEPEPS